MTSECAGSKPDFCSGTRSVPHCTQLSVSEKSSPRAAALDTPAICTSRLHDNNDDCAQVGFTVKSGHAERVLTAGAVSATGAPPCAGCTDALAWYEAPGWMPWNTVETVLLVVVVGIGFLIAAWVRMKSTEIAITNKRIIAKFGFVKRSTVEINLDKVEALRVEHVSKRFDGGRIRALEESIR